MRKLWRLPVGKRSSSSFTFSLRYYKDIVNVLLWVLWACLAKQTLSDTVLSTCKKPSSLFASKTSPPCFWRYAKICKLILGTLGMPGCTQTQNDSINLQKTSMFICMPKLNSIIHFFHFKQSFNLIGWQYFGP